ncbi:hypothetical protein ES703_75237 [subsurface metagenome]
MGGFSTPAAPGIAGVKVRKNSQMPILGTRPQLNLIEGAAIDLKLADNPPDDEIDITVSAKYPTRFMTLIPEDAGLPATGGAALSSEDGTNFTYECLDFDKAAEEAAFWEWYLTPDYLSENIVVDIYWIATPASGDVKFGFSVLGRQKGEAWDSALGTERTVVQTTGGDGVLNKARITTFSPGWSPGDVVLFKLARKAADAADTLDADARVVKVVVSYTGQFAQSFYPLAEPVKLTLTQVNTWTDIDVSSYVPAGTTGVILHFVDTHPNNDHAIGVRKKGSTDNRTQNIARDSHYWGAIGVDENRKFQYYVGHTTEVEIYLVAYTATGVVFFDNGYDKTPGIKDSWQDIDLSAECPGAIGIIVEVVSDSTIYNYGFRKKGSTDDRKGYSFWHSWAIIGCDSSQVIKGYAQNGGIAFFVIGYVTEGAVFRTNGASKSLTECDVWKEIDCSTEAPKSVMQFFEIEKVYFTYDYGLRKRGSTENIYHHTSGKLWAMVACDSGQKVEGKIGSTEVDFYLVGYATWAGA